MKLNAYLIFYILFIFLEFLSFLYPQLLIKFDILIPVAIYSIDENMGLMGLLMTLLFSVITGISQGFVLSNIYFALFCYLVILYLRNKLIIRSKRFIFIFSLIALTTKCVLIIFLNKKTITLYPGIPYIISIFILVNSLLSYYILSFVTISSKFINKFYEKNTYHP